MKIIFRPIFIIFFTILAVSFSLSMRRSSWQTEKIKENLALAQAEQKRLLLREQELIYQEKLASSPLTQARIIHDQKWLKAPGEENLELANWQYQERKLPLITDSNNSPWQEWQVLLSGQF